MLVISNLARFPRNESSMERIRDFVPTDFDMYTSTILFQPGIIMLLNSKFECTSQPEIFVCFFFVAFVEKENSTMSSIRYVENHVSYFV